MNILAKILKTIDLINETIGKYFSFMILAIIFIICYEVIARSVFNIPTIWAHELSTYPFAALILLGGAYVLRFRAHVNVDIFYTRVSPRARAILDIITSFFFYLFIGTLVWLGGQEAVYSVKINETSQTLFGPPLYPFKVGVAFGAILILIQGTAKLTRDWLQAITGRETTI